MVRIIISILILLSSCKGSEKIVSNETEGYVNLRWSGDTCFIKRHSGAIDTVILLTYKFIYNP
jgi:hypothetical protein